MDGTEERLEEQITEWRANARRRWAIDASNVQELESHLRQHVTKLLEVGLALDEAFLVALRRIGETDQSRPVNRSEIIVVFGFAAAAAIAVKIPELFGYSILDGGHGFYARNLSFFVLPLLAGYFGWKRGLYRISSFWITSSFFVALVLANVFPFAQGSATALLTAIHLPIALWLAVGIAYVGGHWGSSGARMDFVRFSGELLVYYVLIALGGLVLTGLTGLMFTAIGLDLGMLAESWLLPCGAAGGLIVAAWLVEEKKDVIERMAPLLTQLFTPLFVVVLLTFLLTMAWRRTGIDIDRDVLIGFDLLLVVVLGLLLFGVSARGSGPRPRLSDSLQLLLVVSALCVDLLVLTAIAVRISEFGFSANKAASLGLNVVLLVNLVWSARLYVGFLRGRSSFAVLERWQSAYLPVYAAWAGFVVAVFPPLFGYS